MYTNEVKAALLELWESSGKLCSKRLAPFLSEFMDVLERSGELTLRPEVKTLLSFFLVENECLLLQEGNLFNHLIITIITPSILSDILCEVILGLDLPETTCYYVILDTCL